MPGAAPRPASNRFSITKFGGARRSAQLVHDDHRRRRYRRRHPGQPDDQPVQDAVQEFKVFRNQFDAQYGNALSAVVAVVSKSGTNQLQRHRLLLRPRRRAERQERLRRTKPRTSRAASAVRPAVRCSATGRSSSPPTSTTTSNDVRIIALPASNPFAAPRTARSPRAAPITSSTPSSTTGSTTRTRCSSATPSTTSSRRTATPLGLAPGRTTSAPRTAWSVRATGCCRPGWSTACGCIS